MLNGPMPLELLEYVHGLFAPEDADFATLTVAAAEFGMPTGWEISSDVGRLFQVLCRAIGAKRVVEFGTLAGHSALWLARALPDDGKVISIEANAAYADFARKQLAQRTGGEKVEVREGGAREWLERLEAEAKAGDQKFDVVFLDADKGHYPEFLDWAVRVLRPGGLLLADNVLRADSWNGQTLLDPAADDPRILAIRIFNERLAAHPQFTSMIIPLRAGIAVGTFQP